MNFAPTRLDGSDTTEDAVLGGRLTLEQPRHGHRVGHDAILLAAATDARPGDHVVELGAGVGAAGLALGIRVPAVTLTLVELDPALAVLAARNAERNGLGARVTVVALDVGAADVEFRSAGLAAGTADCILMNPPFNESPRHRLSPDRQRRLAHASTTDTLAGWVGCARRLLRPQGVLTLIWRADGLAEVMQALAADFGGLTILPVYPRGGKPAIRVLMRAVKGGRAPLTLLGGLTLGDEAGRPTLGAEAVLRGGEALPLETA